MTPEEQQKAHEDYRKKRRREALGEDFWYYAETFFSVLESGGWNSNLPSISSLFKELSKIKLAFE
ncbi:hypothetical protein [Paenibacillus polymyxa]|uniref:hypothetical protein n=1 Tax=Paenibacillus TaxID=44249 RepID=UPI000A99DF81|nr:hypothetical protein [Paenibacillus polymyxa]MCH6188956.1 hypothetical protein [Paenibacillus polymyxa]WRL57785.1 hypothetical protein U3G77_05760 [Paenibacillus polymyxa]